MIRSFVLAALIAAAPIDAAASALRSSANAANQYEVGIQRSFPLTFGEGEFTAEVWVRPDNSFPVGACGAGGNNVQNWCTENNTRYSFDCWWCNGNFLIDGIGAPIGSYALQFYGGGRIRWLIGDSASSQSITGGLWGIGPGNSQNPVLLDGQWHHVATVRRFVGNTQSQLELWVDGVLIDTQTSSARSNFATVYADAALSTDPYVGWFYLAEKQAINVQNFVFEDYKGLLDEVRLFNRAKTTNELSTQWQNPVTTSSNGLVGWFDFSDVLTNAATQSCDRLSGTRCMSLRRTNVVNESPFGSNAIFANGFE
jgi:hypothetical protein